MARLAVRVPCDSTVGDVLAAAVEVASGIPDDIFSLLTGTGRNIRWYRALDIDSTITTHARAVVAASRATAAITPSGPIETIHDDDAARTTATVDRANRSWRLTGIHRHRVIDGPFDVRATRDADGWTVATSDWRGVVKRLRHGVRIESLASGGRASGHGTIELQRHGTDRVDVRAHAIEISDRLGLRSLRATIHFGDTEMDIRLRGRLRARGAGRLAVLAWPLIGWWVGRKITADVADWPAAITSDERWPDIVAVADTVLATKRTSAVHPTPKPQAPQPIVQLPMQPAAPVRHVGGSSSHVSPSRRTLLRLAPVPLLVGIAAAAALPWLLARGSREVAAAAIATATACEPDDVIVPGLDLAWDDPNCLRMQDEAFHRRVEAPDGRTLRMLGWRVDTTAEAVGDTQWMRWGDGPASDLCFTADAGDGSLDRGDVVDCFGPGLVTITCPSEPSTSYVFAEECKGHDGLTMFSATRRTLLEDDRGQRTETVPAAVPVVAALVTGSLASGFLLVAGTRRREAG